MTPHERLIHRYLEGELTDNEWLELVDWLHADAEHRRQFVHWSFEHRLLRDTLAVGDDELLFDEAPAPVRGDGATLTARVAAVIRSYPVISYVVATIVVGITLGLMAVLVVRPAVRWARDQQALEHVVVARLAGESDCVWDPAQQHVFAGAYLRAGQLLQLNSGIARVDFDDGARVILHGPATLRLESAGRAMLETGRLVGHVPPAARGFTIATPAATIVDLGTEFGIDTSAEQTFVHVFQGAVEVSPTPSRGSPAAPQRIAAGNSGQWQRSPAAATTSSVAVTHVSVSKFVRALPGDHADLLAYEPFGAADHVPLVEQRGGYGFGGSPWTGELNDQQTTRATQTDYPQNVGFRSRFGHFENRSNRWHAAQQLRRMQSESSVDLASDGEYFVSFLARKFKNDSLGLVGLLDGSSGRGLEFGWSYSGGSDKLDQILIDGLGGKSTTGGMPNNAYQFFVVKIVARAATPDRAYLKQYDAATDNVHRTASELEGEGAGRDQWTLITPEFSSNLLLNELSLRSDGPAAYVQFDEIRLGRTWAAVTGLQPPAGD